MARKQVIQTTVFFIMAYALTPWICNLVVDYVDADNLKQTAMQNN